MSYQRRRPDPWREPPGDVDLRRRHEVDHRQRVRQPALPDGRLAAGPVMTYGADNAVRDLSAQPRPGHRSRRPDLRRIRGSGNSTGRRSGQGGDEDRHTPTTRQEDLCRRLFAGRGRGGQGYSAISRSRACRQRRVRARSEPAAQRRRHPDPLPTGVYVPVFGVTFGDGTTPQSTKVLQVTKQYDGVGDAPNYFLNVASDVNAALGFYYLHGDYYKDVDPTPDPNRAGCDRVDHARRQRHRCPGPHSRRTAAVDPAAAAARRAAEHGQRAGPVPAVGDRDRLQPAHRPGLVSVRTRSVPIGSAADKWLSDIQSVAAGAAATTQRLITLGQPPRRLRIQPATVQPAATGQPEIAVVAIEPRSPCRRRRAPRPGAERRGVDRGRRHEQSRAAEVSDRGLEAGRLLRSLFAPKPADDGTKQDDTRPSPIPAMRAAGTNDSANGTANARSPDQPDGSKQ